MPLKISAPSAQVSFLHFGSTRRRAAHALALIGAIALAAPAFAEAQVASPRQLEAFSSPDGNYLAGLVAGAEHDTAGAALFLAGTLSADPGNAQLMERTFVALLSNGNMNQAFDVADRLLKQDANNSLAQLVLGVKAVKAKQFSKARGDFQKSGSKSDLTANLLAAWSYAGAGQTKKALATLDGLKQDRFKVFRDYHEGLIEELAKNPAQARPLLKAAYDADSQTLRIVDAWARFNDRNGDPAEAKRAYQAFDKLLPRHPLVVAALAELAAGKKLQPLIRSPQAGAAEVLYGLGAAGGQQSDDLAAMIYLRLALYLAPHNALAKITLADLYERLNQHESAIQLYESVPKTSPLRGNAEVQIALITDELGRHGAALKQLGAIVSKKPDDVEALTALANLQRSHSDFAAAADTYTKVLAKTGGDSVKSNWSILYFRGICNERLNHWPVAEADFKQALALFPNQPLVLNYLGYSWVNKGLHLNAGFKMLRKAVQLQPDDGYIVDSLGWAYYKLGKYKHAQRELEKAVQLKPADPTLNEHLGDIDWRLGHKLEAHFQWNYARDFGPDPKNLPRILQKIAHGMPPLNLPAASDGQPASQPAKTGG